MKSIPKYFTLFLLLASLQASFAQEMPPASLVNVFLGTSGDHGQLSPGASSPFGMLDICPQTYPNTHTGYEYKAKQVLGFTHNRMEGVGCRGSGGNLLIKPFIGNIADSCELMKNRERAEPGYYGIGFKNGIRAEFSVLGKSAVEHYHFPKRNHGFAFDLSHTLANRFIDEQHHTNTTGISGWIESGTTCSMGAYRIYYAVQFDCLVHWQDSTAHTLIARINGDSQDVTIRVAFSSVSVAYAQAAINKQSFETVKTKSRRAWDKELSQVIVKGDPKEERLFFSLLYRTLQTPFNITEPNGTYKGADNAVQHTDRTAYSGWSIWDNYRTELPLLSIMQPEKYQDMVTSIANLYRFGKKEWATRTEPSNTVRTEHAMVVLLDAYRKGYHVDFRSIRDSLLKETDNLDFSKPDKALESSYDTWAMSQILTILHKDSLSKVYQQKAANWKAYWKKDFADLSKPDVDKLEARGMYQGTIWQYRWFVPFDVKGLMEQCGGEAAYLKQLEEFFAKDYYNAANEPDIQAPYQYQFTPQPWKSQAIIHHYAKDTVIQYYEDLNYRGIGPQIGRVYNNRPEGLLKTMDEDAGEMSSWYVMAACGLSPACVGWPVYYLHVPLFKRIKLKAFTIEVLNFSNRNKYISSVTLNGQPINRNWVTQQEIMKGGQLKITASATPNKKFGIDNQWLTDLNKNP